MEFRIPFDEGDKLFLSILRTSIGAHFGSQSALSGDSRAIGGLLAAAAANLRTEPRPTIAALLLKAYNRPTVAQYNLHREEYPGS